jgi:hypothetical protein
MEAFRFVTLRAPQLISPDRAHSRGIRAYERNESPFVGELVKLRSFKDARKRMSSLAESRLAAAVADAGTESVLDLVAQVDNATVGRMQGIGASRLSELVSELAGEQPSALVGRHAFLQARVEIADRLVASMILARPRLGAQRDGLMRRIRIGALVELLGTRQDTVTDAEIEALLRGVIYLPAGILPLPSTSQGRQRAGDDGPGPPDDKRSELEAEMRAARLARSTVAELFQSQLSAPKPDKAATDSKSKKRSRLVPFGLSEASIAKIDAPTAKFLAERSLDPKEMSAPSIVAALERRMRAIAVALPSPIARRPIAVIGTHATYGNDFYVPVAGDGDQVRTPGPCVATAPPAQEQPAVAPVPTSIGVVRVAGIGDLLKVEQTTRRYELGEIAHIENVLSGEQRARRHRRTDTTEETLLTQAETIDETERDLESTDRFELQKEAANVIATDASKEVGLTITASYGPTVDATLNSNFATSNSTENSSRTSTSYAHETTDRTVARLTRRTLETRTRRTLTEIVETNKHSFTNDDAGATNIVGIYRWVDKVYESNLVRYGQRLFVECVLPDPASFIRFADSKRATELPDLQRPDPPGYCVDGRFEPLTVDDIDAETYLDWAAAYGLADVTPPPPLLRVIGLPVSTEKTDQQNQGPWVKTMSELTIPAGYLGVSASVSDLLDLSTAFGGPSNPIISIGEEVLTVEAGREPGVSLSHIEGAVPISVWSAANSLPYSFNVLACCERQPEAFQQWQITTYTSIMGAYNTMLNEYNERLAALDVGTMQIRGRSPLLNREIERTELKRLSIEMMTNQHFDSFGLATTDALGFPSIDVDDADRKGRYIQFFEQMFEWTNMTYVFYPYFWSRKSQWPALVLLDDVDPLFARFLQAGAARVQLPVRPGYESALIYFIESGGTIWEGGDPPHLDDPGYVSLVDEIRAIEGVGNTTAGAGLVDVTSGSATVTGTGTQFQETDVGREITIQAERFTIRDVVSTIEIVLNTAFGAASATGLEYSLGGWYVGPPWEVTLPTSLVALQDDSHLPTWPSSRP